MEENRTVQLFLITLVAAALAALFLMKPDQLKTQE
jgi:hypothetical protein